MKQDWDNPPKEIFVSPDAWLPSGAWYERGYWLANKPQRKTVKYVLESKMEDEAETLTSENRNDVTKDDEVQEMRDAINNLSALVEALPSSRRRSIALTNLEISGMMAIKAIYD
tara:strand:- start:3893 stop:4234 length:342 start_codon:yes stop_codon:yes gene_type:complete